MGGWVRSGYMGDNRSLTCTQIWVCFVVTIGVFFHYGCCLWLLTVYSLT